MDIASFGIASVACITVICVALRKESVDRNNSITATRTFEFDVALRKESMEWFSF